MPGVARANVAAIAEDRALRLSPVPMLALPEILVAYVNARIDQIRERDSRFTSQLNAWANRAVRVDMMNRTDLEYLKQLQTQAEVRGDEERGQNLTLLVGAYEAEITKLMAQLQRVQAAMTLDWESRRAAEGQEKNDVR